MTRENQIRVHIPIQHHAAVNRPLWVPALRQKGNNEWRIGLVGQRNNCFTTHAPEVICISDEVNFERPGGRPKPDSASNYRSRNNDNERSGGAAGHKVAWSLWLAMAEEKMKSRKLARLQTSPPP
jgi:hypothetical protein